MNDISIGIVSTWKCKCGIAIYSKHLRDSLRQLGIQADVIDIRDPIESIKESCKKYDLIHLQNEPLFCNPGIPAQIKSAIQERPMITTLHRIDANAVCGCSRFSEKLITLCPANFSEIGAPEHKLIYMDMGTLDRNIMNKTEAKMKYGFPISSKVITTTGFLTGWKLISPVVGRLLNYIKIVPNVILQILTSYHFMMQKESEIEAQALYGAIIDTGLADRCVILTDFLPDDILHSRICASDVGFIYAPMHTGSSSAAARRFVSAGVPLVVTESNHFSTLSKGVKRTPFDIEEFLNGVRTVTEDDSERNKLALEMLEFREETLWSKVAAQHLAIYREVICQSKQWQDGQVPTP